MAKVRRKDGSHNGAPGGGGPMGGMMPAEKAKDAKGTLKRLIKYLRADMPVILSVFVLAIIGTIFTIVTPKILGQVTNELQSGIMKGIIDMDKVISIMVGVLSMYICSALFNFVSGFLSAGLSQKVVYKLRKEIKDKLARLPISYYDVHQTGDVLSRITNDVELISTSLQQSITQLITGVITIVGTVIMMLTISGWLTLICLLTLPLLAVIIMVVAKKSQKKFKAQQDKLGEINGYIEEIYSAKKIVKLYGKEEDCQKSFDGINTQFAKIGTDAQFLSGTIMPLFNLVNNIGYVGICVVGGLLAGQPNPLLIGDIQSFLQYQSQFTQPIAQTANIMNTIQSTIAAAERIFGLLDEKEEPVDTATPFLPSEVEPFVEFQNVDFSYDKDKELIKNLSLNVPAQGKIAIVGPTGAGKTTLVNLLLRFYEIDSGKILIGGKDIKDFTKEGLRSLFGMVLQDTWLESGTIAENIAYGKPTATIEEIIAAAQKANIHHYIETLPDGYNTVLNEEVSNISNGQKQLLTIARAILSDNKILILDEATSSVDTRTESYIQNAMTELLTGKTSFVIAHRLSTIRSSSLILVMQNGNIAEQGTHDELMKKGGIYYNLYNSQFSNVAI